MDKKPIAVDFDGVLHQMKEGYDGPKPQGDPIKDARWALDKLHAKGFDVIVFTTRKETDEVSAWLKKHKIPHKKVTNTKPIALAYVDDRGIRFTNWEDIVKYFI